MAGAPPQCSERVKLRRTHIEQIWSAVPLRTDIDRARNDLAEGPEDIPTFRPQLR